MTEVQAPETGLAVAERLLLDGAGSSPATGAVVDAARRQAEALARTAGDEHGVRLAITDFTGDLLAGLWLEGLWTAGNADERLERIEQATGAPRVAVALRALRDPGALLLSPHLAADLQVGLLHALTGARAVAVWTWDADGDVHAAAHAGDPAVLDEDRANARTALAEESAETSALAAPVLRLQQLHAVLVLTEPRLSAEVCPVLLDAAAGVLGAVFDREALLTRNADGERALMDSAERRLARLGFDLHDGPLQGLAALAEEVRLFRSQLQAAQEQQMPPELLGGRVDDLEARIGALDQELRAFSSSLSAPMVLARPLPQLLREALDAFAVRTEMVTDLHVSGDLERLSNSQRIALLRILEEGLNNVREHSGASRVHVAVTVTSRAAQAVLVDDGHGFDVEDALMDTARRGRRGLLGMVERARLLGGVCRVDSRPGGPTSVTVSLPAWQPVTASPAAIASR